MATPDVNCSAPLSPLERGAVAALLEEFTDALAIYRYHLQKSYERASDVSSDRVCTSAEASPDGRLAVALRASESASPRDTEMINREAIAAMKHLRGQVANEKLQRDSQRVAGFLRDLEERVVKDGTFEPLLRENKTIAARLDIEGNAIREAEESEKAIDRLRRALAEREAENERVAELLKRKLLDTRDRMETSRAIGDVERAYVTGWERARREQNSLSREIDLNQLAGALSSASARDDDRNRVNAELLAFLARDTASIEERIGVLQERHCAESLAYSRQIDAARDEIEARRSVLKELGDEYRSNQEFIDACLAEKEAVRKRKEREEHMKKSATRIQAWWRGVMVRRKLGPYRPEEKKKKRAVKAKK